MINAEWQRLLDNYVEWIKRGLKLSELDDGCEILTPFLDRHNDIIAIYAEKFDNQLRLSDDGYTISDLRSSGMEFTTEKRRAYLSSVLAGFGIKQEGDTLTVTATPADFPQKKHNLLQAILAINDMAVMAEEHVVSFFKEDVAQFLVTHQVPVLADIKLTGKTGLDHRFDFALPRRDKKPELVVRAITALDKHNATDFAFAVADIRLIRPESLGAVAFINDQIRTPADDNLNALRVYEIQPFLWSHRDESLSVLNGSRS
jgi:hypothetical protein